MKIKILIVIYSLLTYASYGQNFSVNETLDYINAELKEIGDFTVNGTIIPNNFYKVFVTDDGLIKLRHINANTNTYDTEQIIHINDVSNIEVTNSIWNSVKLNCINNQNCCRWEGFLDGGGIQGHNYLMISVPDSRSGEKIKNALLYLIKKVKPNLKNNDPFAPKFNNANVNSIKNSNSSPKAYVCGGRSSYAFHCYINCEGLNNCDSTIYETTQASAYKDGYVACKLCYE